MGMSKRDIMIAGESGYGPYGSRLDFADVARLSRDKRVITLRHVWPDDTDARVWHAISGVVTRRAVEIAEQTGKSVEIYAKEGFQIEQIEPLAASAHDGEVPLPDVLKLVRAAYRGEAKRRAE